MARLTCTLASAVLPLVLTAPLAAAPKSRYRLAAERERWVAGVQLGDRGGPGFPFVLAVRQGSPAYYAGLREGDEILRVQEEEVRGLDHLGRALAAIPRGGIVRLHVRRTAAELAIEFASPGQDRASAAPQLESSDATSSPGETPPARDETKAPATTLKPEAKQKMRKRASPLIFKPITR